MAEALIVFRNLPGISVLESDQMIAEKFHQRISGKKIDDASKAIFDTTEAEIGFEPPQWFKDGYDSVEEWNAAPETDEDDEVFDDWSPDDLDIEILDLNSESPQRLEIMRQAIEFDGRLKTPDFRDDYDRMNYAKTFGFDFSDNTGMHPLRITRFFFRQALAAARGVMGHLPDHADLALKSGEKNLNKKHADFDVTDSEFTDRYSRQIWQV